MSRRIPYSNPKLKLGQDQVFFEETGERKGEVMGQTLPAGQ